MKIQRGHRTAFAALSIAALLLPNDAIASSSTSSSTCIDLVRGDGHCDLINNNDNCGYDGGDCCQCTCTSTLEWSCGANGFHCLDPSASCVDDDDGTVFPDATTTSLGCVPAYSGDGDCDLDNNNEECGYDGGDCCQCTCVSTPAFTCGTGGFPCVDPIAPCVGDDDGTVVSNNDTTSSGCISEHFGDGDCDTVNNSEECGYDGGDCCQCTCVSTAEYVCGANGFQCVDPSAICADDDDDDDDDTVTSYTPTSTPVDCIPNEGGDGYCDPVNNKDECGYDGGDCCQCTCIDTAAWSCGANGFQCVDPSATCADDDDDDGDDTVTSYTPTSTPVDCIPSESGDGFCDPVNNKDECGYDGGDCCQCTCIDTAAWSCGANGFQCVDPSATCADDHDDDDGDDTVTSYTPTSTPLDCIPNEGGDGYCDPVNNKDECGYDGGDCCKCTCIDTATWRCGANGFQCVDPSATCAEDDDDDDDDTVARTSESPTLSRDDTTSSSDCIGGFLGDGFCDSPNNNEDCGYDNGDCCPCTCVSTPAYPCDMEGFQCVDPNASCVDVGDPDSSISLFGDEMLGSYSFSESDEDNSDNSAAVSTLAVPLFPLLFAALVSPCISHVCLSSL